MMRILLALFVLCSFAVAQESEPLPPQPPVGPRTPVASPATPMRGVNPTMLIRMRDQMTFELQQIQRQLGFIDPRDTQLHKTFTDRQAELLAELKDLNAQLKEQGIAAPDDAVAALPAPDMPRVPVIPPGVDPTLFPGGMPSPPLRDEEGRTSLPAPDMPRVPRNPLPNGMMGGIVPEMPGVMPMPPGVMPGEMSGFPITPPTPHDQDQAWVDSPWAPRPSKELAELKQTVDGLRKELGEMRETIKALETQIQLLNRNFLLMNQPPG